MARKQYEGDLKDYNPKYLRCRGRKQHRFAEKTDIINITTKTYRGVTRVTEYTERFVCERCESHAFEKYSVSKTGHIDRVGTRWYDYAPGYELKRGEMPLEDARDLLQFMELASKLDAELFRRLAGMRGDKVKKVRRLRAVS